MGIIWTTMWRNFGMTDELQQEGEFFIAYIDDSLPPVNQPNSTIFHFLVPNSRAELTRLFFVYIYMC